MFRIRDRAEVDVVAERFRSLDDGHWAAKDLSSADSFDEFLMEEFLDGPEISVETLTFDGRHVVVAVTDKEIGGPGFVEIGHSQPSGCSAETLREVTRLVTDFLDAVGLRNGPGHTEVKLTSRGPRIVESHNRVGGGRINELAEIAYGVDMERYALGAGFGLVEPLTDVARASGRGGRPGPHAGARTGRGGDRRRRRTRGPGVRRPPVEGGAGRRGATADLERGQGRPRHRPRRHRHRGDRPRQAAGRGDPRAHRGRRVSTAPPVGPGVDEPRFRDALRSLPGRVWIVSLGILVNRVGNFLPVFIVLYLTERGYSAGAAGLVLGVAGLGNMLGNAVGGYLTDKIGRRWTIVSSAVPTAGLTAIVPFLAPFPVIVTVVGLIGVTSQIYRPAAAAVLLDSVTTNQQRLAAFGVFRFAMNIGAALGGVIGGVLASTSYVELFLANAAACLLFGVVMAVLLRDAPQPQSDQDDDADPQADRAVGYRQALADRTLVRFLRDDRGRRVPLHPVHRRPAPARQRRGSERARLRAPHRAQRSAGAGAGAADHRRGLPLPARVRAGHRQPARSVSVSR